MKKEKKPWAISFIGRAILLAFEIKPFSNSRRTHQFKCFLQSTPFGNFLFRTDDHLELRMWTTHVLAKKNSITVITSNYHSLELSFVNKTKKQKNHSKITKESPCTDHDINYIYYIWNNQKESGHECHAKSLTLYC